MKTDYKHSLKEILTNLFDHSATKLELIRKG